MAKREELSPMEGEGERYCGIAWPHRIAGREEIHIFTARARRGSKLCFDLNASWIAALLDLRCVVDRDWERKHVVDHVAT